MIFEIPLSPGSQNFKVTLNKVEYGMSLLWNNHDTTWILNISNNKGIQILSGIPLVPNVDLLGQFRHMGFVGKLVAVSLENKSASPGYWDIGSSSKLLYIPD